ncbi:hypothetical protein KAI04_00980 [Candidatus Pacearchaeota archaeon]|nr:hypothetical protein [Candidatus Pacearchaeota archaeon]
MVVFKIPKKHQCGKILEEKTIPINPKILTLNPYPINYCSKCNVYVLNEKYQSKDPEIIGDIITEAQAQQNLKINKSIYHASHLEKIAEKTSKTKNN